MRRDSLQFLLLILLLVAPASVAGAQGVAVSHLYYLSDFNGTIEYRNVNLHVDRSRDEVYVIDGNVARIFNASGMEVFDFGPDPRLGIIASLAVDEDGDILVLSPGLGRKDSEAGTRLVRCNYRGEPLSHIEFSGLPDAFAGFHPDGMVYRDGRLHLLGASQLTVVVTDVNGVFERGYDLGELMGIPEKERADTVISGFDLDAAGNMLFTVPVQFRAYVISPEGDARAFGRPGSAPGAFGLVAGIVEDDHGNYLVADIRRHVVIVFDSNFKYITEFGYAGYRADNLIRPSGLGVGDAGKVYVTQRTNRGVSVYSVLPN